MNPGADDTIAAIATTEGRGAIAVLRISGPHAFDIARQHVNPWPASHRHVTLCTVRDRDREVLDEALVTTFVAPLSFTGEDVVEIATHGGQLVPTLVLAAMVSSGARIALPGEFTRRAVINGKMDLVQAEATGDLIDSTSRAMQRVALAQLDGGLSRRIEELRDEVIELEALISYDIDFPDEDDGPIPRSRVEAAISEVIASLESLIATAPAGELVRSGALVVIAGEPNVGKSSLFNAMLGKRRAIVTEIPGTTRDAIEAVLDTGEWPLRIVDTAGIRETTDAVERLGIEVAREYLESADVVLACGETTEEIERIRDAVTAMGEAHIALVQTKSDLGAPAAAGKAVYRVSATSGDGINALVDGIAREVSERFGGVALDAPVITRERQRYCVAQALEEMIAFDHGFAQKGLPVSIAAVHLRSAANALADVTGTIDVEEVLDRLFRTFCVGK
ncbi:MAG: tRNA uridine-5-carboxymethylaminomethyl(34) synthesis GTPase MnmE [Gemmatimonadota bacterium]|nr:tRNA uridine-5-carboxymethylaminomethyl(34) synthesis GTPase MnmE [Gemmatimonadota bacterium]